jgi:BirA family transcriptional regulator, biotin operon repressor / biotin---[acetyl-CoA-carboxylase] ligase
MTLITRARFDTALLERSLVQRGAALGLPTVWKDETESTNDDALAAAKSGASHGALFGAETQARGRGRRGSAWVSTPGAGLWFSLLLRPRLSAEVAPGLALCAGLSVREAVATRVTAPVLVKWPNDVLVDGRKLAGILVESQVKGRHIESVIIGIGINVAQREFPESIAGLATSLSLQGASDTAREPLLADVLAAFEHELSRLEQGGLPAVADALRDHDALYGRELRIEGKSGIGGGIDGSGRLRLKRSDGRVELIDSGHVELVG